MGIDLILGVVVGVALGFGFSLFFRKNGSDSSKVKELETQHEQYRKQVDDHFVNTAVLFKGLTDQYRDVYRHIATGAGELCSEEAKALQTDLEETALLEEPTKEVEVTEPAEEAVPETKETPLTEEKEPVEEEKAQEDAVVDGSSEVKPAEDEASANDEVPLASEVEMSAEVAEEIKNQAAKKD